MKTKISIFLIFFHIKLIIVDKVINDVTDEHNAWLDILMLVCVNGKQRTEGDFRYILSSAGFKLTNIQYLSDEISLVEAEKM